MEVSRKETKWIIFDLSDQEFKSLLKINPDVRIVSVERKATGIQIYAKDEE